MSGCEKEIVKKIDIHAHAVRDYVGVQSSIKITGAELVEMYDGLGIEKGILLPIVSPEGMDRIITNEEIIEIVHEQSDRLLWFCNVDPRACNNSPTAKLSKLLEYYKSLGAKGVGEVTANLYFDDPKTDNLLSCCEEMEMPVIFHLNPSFCGSYGLVDELGLPRLEKMLKKHKKLTFIGHSAAFWSEISADNTDEIRNGYPKGKVTEGRLATLLRENENLTCDLSAGSGANAMMRDREYAAGFLAEFCDRIMYGCDIGSPANTHPYTFSEFLDSMRECGELSEANYKKICRENAEKLLKI